MPAPTIANVGQLWATQRARFDEWEGDFGRRVEVEVAGKAVFFGDVDFGGSVGVVEVGLPLFRMAKVEGYQTQHRHQRMGAFEVDHVAGDSLGELRERRLHGVHVVERRQRDVEALGASAGSGQTELPRTIAKMVGTVFLVFGSDRVANAASVVGVSTGAKWFSHECSLVWRGRGNW
jgi:hypothetical protein